jgi:cell fate regulator YaaT (PSP1 superfamily)
MVQNTENAPNTPALGCSSCRIAGVKSRCGNGLEKIFPTTAVRFGYMKTVGEFTHHPDMVFSCGAKVVIQTQRGIEIGEQVSLTCNGCSKSVTREQIQTYIDNSGRDAYLFDSGRILREATPDDLRDNAHIRAQALEEKKQCQDLAESHRLAMKVVECEHLFGGERVVFYFTASGRVDFRGLVRDLAKLLHTRIEMRQIGARDEARLVADYETCGRECCCKAFLKELKPVNMKMAKLQKSTLDPSKVSGRCGRLKCCLRYEHTSYQELDRRLPPMGTWVHTAHGDGEVVNRQILTQLVQIRTKEQGTMTVCIEDVLPPEAPGAPAEKKPKPAEGKAPSTERSTSAEAVSEAGGSGPAPKESRRSRRRRSRRRSGRRPGRGSQGQGPKSTH